jgi:FkbM family methyltransferase
MAINAVLVPLGFKLERCELVSFGQNLNEDIAVLGRSSIQTIFDVGAHQGESALEFLKLFPQARIHSFEPFPDSFAHMKKRVAAHDQVVPVNLAASDHRGTAEFTVNRNALTNSLLPNAAGAVDNQPEGYVGESRRITVHLTTLDDYCAEKSIESIHLLKIDTQGAEMMVLRGARRLFQESRVGILYCEVNFVPMYEGQAQFHEIHDFLGRFGMQFVGFYNVMHVPHYRFGWCEALFCSPEIAAAVGA